MYDNKPPKPKGTKINLQYVDYYDAHRIWRGLTTGNWSMDCD